MQHTRYNHRSRSGRARYRGQGCGCLVMLLAILVALGAAKAAFGYDNASLKIQIHELAVKQQAEIDTLTAHLEDSRNTATALAADLLVAQKAVKGIAGERDGWENHARNSDLLVSQKTTHILRLYIVIGVMTVAAGIYGFLKFYLHVPFL